MRNLALQLRSRLTLRKAWRQVESACSKSSSADTRAEARAFAPTAEAEIERIYRQLHKDRFEFAQARGAPIRRTGKASRPIVIASIRDRIVQRAILDVLQDQQPVVDLVTNPSSFGGVKSRRVRDAIELAAKQMHGGQSFYLRSDIPRFFTAIPRELVLRRLVGVLPDSSIDGILDGATLVDLKNASELGHLADLFPDESVGVAQGCCLSPLLGNVLLSDLDAEIASMGVTYIRYIDDFLILAETEMKAMSAFDAMKAHLSALGLAVYGPEDSSGKFGRGDAMKGFEFLGCQLSNGFIQPTKAKRDEIIDRVRARITESLRTIGQDTMSVQEIRDRSIVSTLHAASSAIRGWTNAYSFCNGVQRFEHVDTKVDSLVTDYLRRAETILRRQSSSRRRQSLGVWLAADGNRDPIELNGQLKRALAEDGGS